MNDWLLYLMEQERRRDEIRRANSYRRDKALWREASPHEKQPLRRHEIMLATLGDYLVVWGCRLQKRHRRLTETTNCMSSKSLLAQQRAESPC